MTFRKSTIFGLAASAVTGTASADSITFAPLSANSTSIPTMGGAFLVAMSILVAAVAFYMLRKHTPNGMTFTLAVLLSGASITGLSGVQIIQNAEAINFEQVKINSRAGGNFPILEGPNNYENLSGVPLKVVSIQIDTLNCPILQTNGQEPVDEGPIQMCQVGLVLNNQESCDMLCFSLGGNEG